jgi:hypothetical protein
MKTKLALCSTLLSITSAMSFGQTVSVNYNKAQDFSQYHTYAWGSNNANQIRNSILAQEAQQDVNTAMMAKGLQMVAESQNPDLLLVMSGGMKEQTSYQTWGGGIGWGGWGGMGTITPEQNTVGTLIVDLYDAKGKSLVWRGVAQNTLSTNGGKNTQMVQKAVTKMFQQYPWPPKK